MESIKNSTEVGQIKITKYNKRIFLLLKGWVTKSNDMKEDIIILRKSANAILFSLLLKFLKVTSFYLRPLEI